MLAKRQATALPTPIVYLPAGHSGVGRPCGKQFGFSNPLPQFERQLAGSDAGGTIVEGRFSAFLMQRRDFLKIAGLAAASSRLVGQQPQSFLAPTAGAQDVAKTDF